jgi:hypothetical protein
MSTNLFRCNKLRSLRPETKDLLVAPRFRNSKFGGRAFSVNASRLWNALHSDVKNNTTNPTFRRQNFSENTTDRRAHLNRTLLAGKSPIQMTILLIRTMKGIV